MSAIQFEKNADNIVILTLDSPNQSANTMNADFRQALSETVEKLKADDAVTAGATHSSLLTMISQLRK